MMVPGFSSPTVMKHDFSRIPGVTIPRSSFKRSHGYKTTLNSGYLIPIYCDEALPGDTFNLKLSSVARLNTPIVPFMDNLHMDFFFFAVPNRLLWNNWQRFCGERDPDPDSSIDYLVPRITTPAGGYAEESLADYFGIPIGIDNLEINALHFRAYNLIYNEWFRDQNLQDSVTVDLDDGPDDPADYVLLKRGKRHDYFTSCLPWPQKGDAIDLPLGTVAPVLGIGKDDQNYNTGPITVYETGQTGSTSFADYSLATSGTTWRIEEDPDNAGFPGIFADLSNATAATINSLREAFQLQRMLERDARGGSRYIELIQSHFGVTAPDFRLQRPEYLGGGSRRVAIDPIPSTLEVTGSRALGDLGAIGFQNQSGVGFTKSFVEHSVIIGLVNIRADLTYQKGVNRMWSRQTRYDYFWPSLSHLGEQAVLNKEIYAQGNIDDDLIFGYQERWAEYRYYPSLITGLMRSDAVTSLDNWHLSQDFSALPQLNSTFIEEDPPIDRVVAVPAEPDFQFDAYFDITCARPMPLYSVPGFIDHF